MPLRGPRILPGDCQSGRCRATNDVQNGIGTQVGEPDQEEPVIDRLAMPSPHCSSWPGTTPAPRDGVSHPLTRARQVALASAGMTWLSQRTA
jgi:hypothetical protein